MYQYRQALLGMRRGDTDRQIALDVADMTSYPHGLELLIRRSKTDQEGQGVPCSSRWVAVLTVAL